MFSYVSMFLCGEKKLVNTLINRILEHFVHL